MSQSVVRWALVMATLVLACGAAAQRTIRGGDRLQVACEQESTLNREVAVSTSGVGSFGLLGPIEVMGFAPETLARRLEILLIARLGLARADVLVSILARDDLPVRYGGAVLASGEVEATDGLRLSDVVALAQPTAAADLEAVVIVSDIGRERRVDFTRTEEDPERFNPLLRSGDRVFFAQAQGSRDVFVLGGVARPRNVPRTEASTVAQAIEACGGLVAHANVRDVSVVRGELVMRLLLPRDGAVRLRSGDTLRVGVIDDRSFVTVLGAVVAPGRVPFFDGMTLGDLFGSARGLLPSADLSRVRIKAGTGTLRTDGSFGAGDLIEVPAAPAGSGRSLLDRLLGVFRRIGG